MFEKIKNQKETNFYITVFSDGTMEYYTIITFAIGSVFYLIKKKNDKIIT